MAALLALLAPVAVRAQEAGPAGGGKEEKTIEDDGRPAIRQHRWDEDWSALCDASRRTEPLDSLKCVELGGDTTLTMSGEARERFETSGNPGFGVERPLSEVFLHRLWLGADLDFGEAVRTFVEVGYLDQSRRAGETRDPDVTGLDLLQAFVDVGAPIGSGRGTVRAGRMEMTFGSQRLVAIRDALNAHQTFNGVRAFWEGSDHRVDAFLTEPTENERGTFDDDRLRNERFWGAYATGPVSGPLNADLYYLGLRRRQASFAIGDGRELRHTIGTRLFGESGGWDWDGEAVYQFGDFGPRRIRAWSVATDVGFTVEDAPGKPRLGMKADIASGDRDPGDGTLGTLNALYPKQPYFTEANFAAPYNIMDIHPSLDLDLGSGLTAGAGAVFQWKHRRADAIYLTDLAQVDGSVDGTRRYIGTQLVAEVEWEVTPQFTLRSQYVRFERGGAVREAGGRDADFLLASAQFRF